MPLQKQLISTIEMLSHWPRFRLRLFLEGLFVGIISGSVISLFRSLLEKGTIYREYIYQHVLCMGNIGFTLVWFCLLLIAAWLLWKLGMYEPGAGGSGIPQVKGVILGSVRMRWFRILWVKLISGIIGIGLGLSLGREGPSIQIGAVVGQGMSRGLKRTRMEERYLITAGASAGLAAAFNAPLAGVIFALEELHRNFSGAVLASAMAAALLSTTVCRMVFGRETIFHFGTLSVLPLSYIWLVVGVSIFVAIGGWIFNACLLRTHLFYELPFFRNDYMRIAFALLTAGILGFVFPYVLGGGNDLINQLYMLPLSLQFFLLLLVAKFLFTLISYGCGVPGGFFLPMLVLGALLGGVIGILLIHGGIIPVQYFSNIIVISMAAFFAASVQSPITGTILIMEMTGSYEHLLVLCTASMVALVVAQIMKGEPIYDTLLQRSLAKNKPQISATDQRHLMELTVASGSVVDGKYIRRITWPNHVVLIDIKRSTGEVLPDFDTRLYAGDYIYVLTDSIEGAQRIRDMVELSEAKNV
ncbi:ClC family H(+)/Cl(-) exchange transporter [Megasphaera sp. UPII 135-E]|uniref:ClC family H(+)/Cl(-) exchange transporter n=1 Tax=Megasphaera sp. UPII 135-E TaxID=1000569 RepID=UPI00021A24A7|nr:ClC family H(+)/Cl(-) exchange transporter [Megasphaera sp. UPII 135-E]EGS32209.1 chloride transporter, ClC family [Megasphaera sp. UPII 135-E]